MFTSPSPAKSCQWISRACSGTLYLLNFDSLLSTSASPCQPSLPPAAAAAAPIPPPIPPGTTDYCDSRCEKMPDTINPKRRATRKSGTRTSDRCRKWRNGLPPRRGLALSTSHEHGLGQSFRVRIIRNGRISTSGCGGGGGRWAFRPGEKFLIATPPRPFCCSRYC
jgi:hypothetical protein